MDRADGQPTRCWYCESCGEEFFPATAIEKTEGELRSDKAAILERLTAACEMLLAKGDTEVFNVLTGNGAHVPKVRRDVLADNERLRGLVKRLEWGSCDGCGARRNCTECSGSTLGRWSVEADAIVDEGKHAPDCPVFTPDGQVKQ